MEKQWLWSKLWWCLTNSDSDEGDDDFCDGDDDGDDCVDSIDNGDEKEGWVRGGMVKKGWVGRLLFLLSRRWFRYIVLVDSSDWLQPGSLPEDTTYKVHIVR